MAEQPEKVIDIPGVGAVAFPASMSDDQINAAASRLYGQTNPKADTPKPKSWIDTAVDWLPSVGGAIGSKAGPMGAAIGGAAGHGYRTLYKNAPIIGDAVRDVAGNLVSEPMATLKGFGEGLIEGATEAGIQGGMQAAGTAAVGKLAQGGKAIAEKAAPALMQAAMKPAPKLTLDAFKHGQVPPVVKTMLDEGVNVSRAGVEKLNALMQTAPAGSAQQDAMVMARNATAERLAQLANTDPEGLLQLLVLRHPAAPSLIARGLWKSAGNALGVPGELIRRAVSAIVQGGASMGSQTGADALAGMQ